MLVAPVWWFAQCWFQQAPDLSRLGEPPELSFAEDHRVVEAHFESPFGTADDRDLGEQRRPQVEQLSRQTGGSIQVVSRDAEFDGDPVLRLNHECIIDGRLA